MSTIQATFYLHDDWGDDDGEWEAEQLAKAGMPMEDAIAFVKTHAPLYEVSITLEIDLDTKECKLVKAEL